MSGIDKIIDQILNEAYERKKQIEKDAQIKVNEILVEAKKEAENIKEEILKSGKAKVDKYEEVANLNAEQRRRQAVLEAKQQLISNTIDKAYQKVIDLNEENYFQLLLKIIKKYAFSQEGEILLNAKDKERMPESFLDEVNKIAHSKGGKLSLSEEVGNFDGGFILIYGGIEENCTIKAMFEERKEDLIDIANKKLFG